MLVLAVCLVNIISRYVNCTYRDDVSELRAAVTDSGLTTSVDVKLQGRIPLHGIVD